MVILIEKLAVVDGVQKVRIRSKKNDFQTELEITPKIERHMLGRESMHFYAILRRGVLHIGTPARESDW